MSLLPSPRTSFFTGKGRVDSLRLRLQYRKGTVYTDFSVGKDLEGHENVVNGAIAFGVLDVIMWYVIFMETAKNCMTRKVDVDFLKPVICDRTYRAQAKLVRVEERDAWVTAWIEGPGKERHTEVRGLFREPAVSIGRDFTGWDFSGVSHEIREKFLSPSP